MSRKGKKKRRKGWKEMMREDRRIKMERGEKHVEEKRKWRKREGGMQRLQLHMLASTNQLSSWCVSERTCKRPSKHKLLKKVKKGWRREGRRRERGLHLMTFRNSHRETFPFSFSARLQFKESTAEIWSKQTEKVYWRCSGSRFYLMKWAEDKSGACKQNK